MSTTNDRTGQQFGNYRLIRLLGKGGSAEVYLGEHILLETQAAIKLLPQEYISEGESENFLREARVVAWLVHPHIIRLLEFGIEENTPYLVMDYAPFGTLRQEIHRGTQLPLERVVEYTLQVAEALQYAHDERMVHRDIKPENMLLGRRKEVLVSDFGIAIAAHSARSIVTQQEFIGTPQYMAPEQITGKPRPASDQYALALVVYEWLAGTTPFKGSFTEILSQHMVAPAPSLQEYRPDLPVAVSRVLARALEKNPENRFPSVLAFANALKEQQGSWSAQAPAQDPWTRRQQGDWGAQNPPSNPPTYPGYSQPGQSAYAPPDPFAPNPYSIPPGYPTSPPNNPYQPAYPQQPADRTQYGSYIPYGQPPQPDFSPTVKGPLENLPSPGGLPARRRRRWRLGLPSFLRRKSLPEQPAEQIAPPAETLPPGGGPPAPYNTLAPPVELEQPPAQLRFPTWPYVPPPPVQPEESGPFAHIPTPAEQDSLEEVQYPIDPEIAYRTGSDQEAGIPTEPSAAKKLAQQIMEEEQRRGTETIKLPEPLPTSLPPVVDEKPVVQLDAPVIDIPAPPREPEVGTTPLHEKQGMPLPDPATEPVQQANSTEEAVASPQAIPTKEEIYGTTGVEEAVDASEQATIQAEVPYVDGTFESIIAPPEQTFAIPLPPFVAQDLYDFYISYTKVDRPRAQWIQAQLEQAGYKVFLPPVDFREGFIFRKEMFKAFARAQRMLTVLSPAYFSVLHSRTGGWMLFKRSMKEQAGKFFAVCVDSHPELQEELFGQENYLSLIGEDDATSWAMLRAYLLGEGMKLPPPSPPQQPQMADQLLMIIKQIRISFSHHEWLDVRRKEDFLLKYHPELMTAELYRLQGIALSELKQRSLAYDAFYNALALATSEERMPLLEDCAKLLMDLGNWNRVLDFANEALELAPQSEFWLDLRHQALARLQGSDEHPLNSQEITVFFSYSQKDEKMRAELEKQLSSIRQEYAIRGWHNGLIRAGDDWEAVTDLHLSQANIVLLLISPDYLASRYCYEREMLRAMERHETGTARVIPIILRPSNWQHPPFHKLHALPSGGHAITTWSNRDEAYLSVAHGIEEIIRDLRDKL